MPLQIAMIEVYQKLFRHCLQSKLNFKNEIAPSILLTITLSLQN